MPVVKPLEEISVEQAKSIYNVKSFIGSELVLFDKFEDVPILSESRRMNGLFVAFCLEGSARYVVDTKEHFVKKNDIIIISRGQVVGDYMLSTDCKGLAFLASYQLYEEIVTNVDDIASLFLFSLSHPVFSVEAGTARTFVNYFNLIQQKVNQTTHHYRDEMVMSLIKAMIYDIGNEIWKLQQHSGELRHDRLTALFTDFLALVQENCRRERRVSWYASQLGITAKRLSVVVKRVSQRTPNQWIDGYVTTDIRVQLKSTSKSIKQLAEEFHFDNQAYFGKYFKEHVGLSPSDFRKR